MLGKDYEMANQNTEHLEGTEVWEERKAAIEYLGMTGMYLASVGEEFNMARDAGNIPQDLWDAYTKAQINNIAAIGALIEVNRRLP